VTENAFAVNVVEDKTVVVDLKGPKLNDFVRDTMSFVGACHWTREADPVRDRCIDFLLLSILS